MSNTICGLGTLSRWGASRPDKTVGGCHTVVRLAQFADEEGGLGISSLVVSEEGGVKKCGVAEVFVFFEVLNLSAESREKRYITHVFCCFWAEFLCDVRVWAILLRCFSFYGRSSVASCSAVRDVQQLLERPLELAYQKTKDCVLK